MNTATQQWIESNIELVHSARYVVRDNIVDYLIEATADLVDKEVTRDWNDGLIANWISSEDDDVFILVKPSELPPDKIEGMGYNCAFSDESQQKMDAYEKVNTKHSPNWGVLMWEGREIVAFSDIDRYACKIWDMCEEHLYEELQNKFNMKIIDDPSDINPPLMTQNLEKELWQIAAHLLTMAWREGNLGLPPNTNPIELRYAITNITTIIQDTYLE